MESTRRRMTPSTPKADFWELDALGARAMGSFGRASGVRPGQAGCVGVPTEVCALGAGPRRASVHQKDAQPRIACEAPEQAGYPGLPSNRERSIYTEPGGNAESPADAAGPRCRRGARSVREPRVPEASGKPRATARLRRAAGPKDAQPATPESPIDAEPAVHAESPADAAGPRRGRGARSVREPRVPEASAEPRATARLRRAAVGPKDAQPSPADEAPGLLAEDSERSAVAAGPRGRRGSRSCRELQGGTLGRREATSRDWNPRPVLDKLRLKRTEISAAASVVNEVVGHLLRKVRKRESEFKDIELLNTGSYYEHVKISAPNEFDVMFKLQVPRIELQEYCNTGAYYFVKFKRLPKGNPLSQFLEEEILSASKMLSKFRKIIEEEVENIEGTNISVEEEKPGSPAVTLIIRNPKEISVDIILALESKGSWPASTKEGLPIERWLGRKVRTKLRLEPFYLVPKNAKEGDGFQGKTWRLSFSHTEKYILNNHGADKTCCETDGVKCCRKECLKLMKCLLEQLKKEFTELDKFCSYHVKTAIFHMWTEKPQDSEWDRKHLRSCFLDFVTYFVECLNTEKLDHFFIPKFNLFSQELVDTKSKEFLSKKIEYERNNRFPIFDKF